MVLLAIKVKKVLMVLILRWKVQRVKKEKEVTVEKHLKLMHIMLTLMLMVHNYLLLKVEH